MTAQIGWGFYNATSGTFGGSTPGGVLGTVTLSYTGSNGTWAGNFESSNLPALQAGTTYQVVVNSHDDASPENTGFSSEILTAAPSTSTSTQTTTSVSTAVSTVTETVQTIPSIVYAALAMLLILGLRIGLVIRVPR